MIATTGNRRAAQFAALLDAPARTDDPELAPYVALAGALRAVPVAAGPTPEFRDALRQRLVAVATVQGVGQPESTVARIRATGITWNFQRRASIVAGTAAAAIAVAGVGVGASRSIPGDAFYGVKRASEDVQLALTTGQEAKGKRHLEFARTRLHEVEALAGRSSALTGVMPSPVGALGHLTTEDKTSTIVATLRDMDDETRAGAQDLFEAYAHSGSAEPLQALDTFTHDQFGDLRDVVSTLPDEAQPRAERSLSLLAVVASQTRQAAVGGGSTPTGGTGTSGQPSEPPSTTPAPGRTHNPGPGHSDGGSSSPTPSESSTPGVPPVPNPVPTDAPTIPILPTQLPVPTQLPSTLPTLPDLSGLPLLGH
jgi:uncharacterized protein DUF5667